MPCERRFGEQEKDRFLNDKLKEELPGIFNWMIKGLHRLKKRGRFESYGFLSESLQDLRDESNPIDVFFREHIEANLEGGLQAEKGELYIKYFEWCKSNGNAPMSAIRFGQAIFQKYSKFTPKKCQCFTTGKRVWKNLKYVHFKDDTKQEIEFEPAVASGKTSSPTTIEASSQQDIDWST
jgi:phage/plasmid-associated DNA primase